MIAPFWKAKAVAYLESKSPEELRALLSDVVRQLTDDQFHIANGVIENESTRRSSKLWKAANS